MQSPPKPYVFESDLALLLSEFVAEKQRLGFKYNSVEAYLKSFDTFLLEKDCQKFPEQRAYARMDSAESTPKIHND